MNGYRELDGFRILVAQLKRRGIQVKETDGHSFPPEAVMHDRGAIVPALVVSPQSEWGVVQTLTLLKDLALYEQLPVSVKSGGHGYFNGASCAGVMVNLSGMTKRRIADDTLFLEPGCILGQTIHTLATHRKAVPHGDCFGVGAGGHFLTAGWDLILARRYGLGCQSVVGGRIVLWDGTVVDVSEDKHPELLYAMRGGAVAGVGIVTEVRLRLIDEPPLATWRFTRISKEQLTTCVRHSAFSNAVNLPREISVSFRFHFEPDQLDPVCSFNIVSLMTAEETMVHLNRHLGTEVASLVSDLPSWSEKSLVDLRMLPASEHLAEHPEMLAEISPVALHETPLVFWKETSSAREMARSYFTSISHWMVPECESIFHELYEAFQSVQTHPARERMYVLVILGGGRISELQESCAMPLGQALGRFELHWDDPAKEEQWCRRFTERIESILQRKTDPVPARPYRGDIWRDDQAKDDRLDAILNKYDRRGVMASEVCEAQVSDVLADQA